jgi:hypothetical protein
MPEYRFYTIRKDGHLAEAPMAKEFPDDDAAREQAIQILDSHHAIEIWQGARVVAYVVPEQKAG